MERTADVRFDGVKVLQPSRAIQAIEDVCAASLKSHKQRSVLSSVARFASAAIAAALLDALFPLPAALRAAATLVFFTQAIRALRTRRPPLDSKAAAPELIAASIERLVGNGDNSLINAVQFTRADICGIDSRTSDLMQIEIRRAERLATSTDVLKRWHGERRAVSARVYGALLLVVVVTSVPLFRLWQFEVPRYLLFWADWPPFSFTRFEITPGNARIDSGSDAIIEVAVSGQQPRSVELVTNEGFGPIALPLEADSYGRYRGVLAGLTKGLRYFVQADTGRSTSYRIEVTERGPSGTPRVSSPTLPPARQSPNAATKVKSLQARQDTLARESEVGGGTGRSTTWKARQKQIAKETVEAADALQQAARQSNSDNIRKRLLNAARTLGSIAGGSMRQAALAESPKERSAPAHRAARQLSEAQVEIRAIAATGVNGSNSRKVEAESGHAQQGTAPAQKATKPEASSSATERSGAGKSVGLTISGATGKYPSVYRSLVRDYFKAVADAKP